MNLKEIAVKCETVEQKKLVSKIMSEELGYETIVGDNLSYPYVAYDIKDCNINAYLDDEFKVKKQCMYYSDFIQHYPKYIIKSGDIVEYESKLFRIIQFEDKLAIINDSDWMSLSNFTDGLEGLQSPITKIVRPNSNRGLSQLQGTTIWQRKSEIDIKREAIQLEIDRLTEELNNLGVK